MQTIGRSIRRPIFHTSVQLFNLFADSAIAYGLIVRLIDLDLISNALAGGIVRCACAPMTIRSVTLLSREAGGDSGAAIVSSALGNFLSVFVSPVLMLVYLGLRSYNIGDITLRLSLRVITPFLLGQALQLTFDWVQKIMNRRKDLFIKVQRYATCFIVYTTFCQTYGQEDVDSSLIGMSTMVGSQVALFVTLLVLSWTTFHLAFSKDSSLRIVAVFACTQKSVSSGRLQAENQLPRLLTSAFRSHIDFISCRWESLLFALPLATTVMQAFSCFLCLYGTPYNCLPGSS